MDVGPLAPTIRDTRSTAGWCSTRTTSCCSSTSTKWRSDQRIWTTPARWEDKIRARELAFSGQEQIITLLPDYFGRFDYSPFRPAGD
ncbi:MULTISPECIES: hypothetical protein [unclassified Frankia]|uniref:hypothetical protein n=1 Tax=unclassified Frankia TaxID=2632575 RepID=UPI001EF4CB40|nr:MULTISPECIES: hypothetical protein [unclassified Frankia]